MDFKHYSCLAFSSHNLSDPAFTTIIKGFLISFAWFQFKNICARETIFLCGNNNDGDYSGNI